MLHSARDDVIAREVKGLVVLFGNYRESRSVSYDSIASVIAGGAKNRISIFGISIRELYE
jgi:hypothetical protein